MKSSDALRRIVESSGMSHRTLARQLGRSPSYISNPIAQGTDMRVSTFSTVADACGYDVLARHRDSGEEILIDPDAAPGADGPGELRA